MRKIAYVRRSWAGSVERIGGLSFAIDLSWRPRPSSSGSKGSLLAELSQGLGLTSQIQPTIELVAINASPDGGDQFLGQFPETPLEHTQQRVSLELGGG